MHNSLHQIQNHRVKLFEEVASMLLLHCEESLLDLQKTVLKIQKFFQIFRMELYLFLQLVDFEHELFLNEFLEVFEVPLSHGVKGVKVFTDAENIELVVAFN